MAMKKVFVVYHAQKIDVNSHTAVKKGRVVLKELFDWAFNSEEEAIERLDIFMETRSEEAEYNGYMILPVYVYENTRPKVEHDHRVIINKPKP
jgi:hypothetical protein